MCCRPIPCLIRVLFSGVVVMRAISRVVPIDAQYLNENPESMDRGKNIITRL
jgi:hypothetical protein